MDKQDRDTKTSEALLPRREVERRCCIRRSTIYELMARGQFPRPVRIGAKAVRWKSTDIDAWIDRLSK